ncbi:MAG: LysR family transcriptional regulator [Rhizobiaceae bacterium]
MDKLTAARYFLIVADTGSFSKTARQLGLPVSTVSRRIKDLEHSMGVELFRRSTRFLSLTEIGQIYYERIKNAVNDFETVEELIRQATGEPSGTIKISALPSFTDMHLYPLLRDFRAEFPKITVDLHTTDRVEHLLRDKFDFAIRPTSAPPENLIAKVIDQHRMLLVASPEYIEKHGAIRRPEDVKSHRALCYRSANGIMPWQSYLDGIWNVIEKVPYFACNNTTELLKITAGGEGIALLPDWTTRPYVQDGQVARINIGWEISFVNDLDHRLYLIYEKKSLQLKRNKVFLDFFMKNLA